MALAAHWLLLAALWLHVRGARGDEALSGRALIAWAAVVALSAAMHVYITFMVMAIATAHFAGTALTAGRDAWRPMAAVAALSAITALVWLVVWALCLLHAYKGRLWKLPIAGRFAERLALGAHRSPPGSGAPSRRSVD